MLGKSAATIASGPVIQRQKSREVFSRLFMATGLRRSVPLQLKDLVFDTEFLTLQIVDRLLVGEGTMDLLIDGAFERSMLFLQRVDTIVQRHAVSSC
jgi:hypothetical protein